MTNLWPTTSCAAWAAALASYDACVASHPSDLLRKRDPWYRNELPRLIASRPEPHVTREELVWVVEWKMARGVWRARNLHLARSNAPQAVVAASRAAFAAAPEERLPLKLLGELKGVGPATASAVLAAYQPARYPFFDDVVAAQVPGLAPVEFTLKAYLAYAAALRERAANLSVACPDGGWTPHAVGMAIWAAAGGKLASAEAGS
jgi:hypothetical protein